MKPSSEIKSEPGNETGGETGPVKKLNSQPVKYATLRPKPLPPPVLRNDHITRARPSIVKLVPLRRCRVKLCPLKDCHLRSHRFYSEQAKRAKNKNISNLERNDYDPKILQSSPTAQRFQEILSSSLVQGGVDGLPALPLDGLDLPVFQQLFHSYFSHHYDRAYRLLTIPPLTKALQLAAAEAKAKALGLALTAPIYCLHAIAAAHHQIVSQRDHRQPDRNSIVLHSKIMALLRAKLDHFDGSEIGDVVAVILILVMFEVAARRFKSLAVHHRAIQQIVTTHGGIYKMTDPGTTTMILTLDRLLSIFTCQAPLYTPPRDHLIRKPAIAPHWYGGYFDDSHNLPILGGEINQYCQDACRAIEMLEWERWSFNPEDPPIAHSPNLHYFFFLRDNVVNEFVRLNVLTVNDKTVARCMLVTTKIVEYTVLMDNYLVALPMELANRVRATICQDVKQALWKDHEHVLSWILFVLTSMPAPWENRPWAVEVLRARLKEKFHDEDWPTDWRQQEHDNVCKFVWSNTRFQSKFAATCNELQYSSIHLLSSARVIPID